MKTLTLLSATLGFFSVWTGYYLFSSIENYITPEPVTIVSSNTNVVPEPTFSRHTDENIINTSFSATSSSTAEPTKVTEEIKNIPPQQTTYTIPSAQSAEVVAGSRTEKKVTRSASRKSKKNPVIIIPPVIQPTTTMPTSTPAPKPQPVPAPTPKPATTTATSTTNSTLTKLKWGVFAGSNPTVIADFERRVPTNPDYLAFFVHWGNGGGALSPFCAEIVQPATGVSHSYPSLV